MRVERLFAAVPLQGPGPGVYDRNSTDDGGLAASAMVARAQERAYAGVEQAELKRTDALLQQGTVIGRAGGVLMAMGDTVGKLAEEVAKREAEATRATEFHGRSVQYAGDTEAAKGQAAQDTVNGGDMQARFRELLNAARDRMLDGVRDPVLRASLLQRAVDKHVAAIADVRKQASAKQSAWSQAELGKADTLRIGIAAENLVDVGVLAEVLKEHDAHTEDLHRAGAMTDEQRQLSNGVFRLTAGLAVERKRLAADPARYLRELESGTYGMVFDDAQTVRQIERARDRVSALDTAAALAEQRAERGAARVLQERGEALAKDGFAMIAQDVDATDFLAANKSRLDKADYAVLQHANRRDTAAKSDPETLVDLMQRLDREDVTRDAARAFRQDRLSTQDYLSIADKNRAALKDEQPASPYRAGRELIRGTLDPTGIGSGASGRIAKSGLLDALTEFDDWAAQNPNAGRADALEQARTTIQRYQTMRYERMHAAADLPRGYSGVRADIRFPDLDAAERRAIQQFDAGALSRSEYRAELKRIANWRAMLPRPGAPNDRK